MPDITRKHGRVSTRYRDNGDGTYSLYVATAPSVAPTATVSSVNAANVNTTLRPASASRKGLIIYNNADKGLYLKYGETATLSDYTVKIAASGGYWEMPLPIYTGVIDGIWPADPTGSVQITELT